MSLRYINTHIIIYWCRPTSDWPSVLTNMSVSLMFDTISVPLAVYRLTKKTVSWHSVTNFAYLRLFIHSLSYKCCTGLTWNAFFFKVLFWNVSNFTSCLVFPFVLLYATWRQSLSCGRDRKVSVSEWKWLKTKNGAEQSLMKTLSKKQEEDFFFKMHRNRKKVDFDPFPSSEVLSETFSHGLLLLKTKNDIGTRLFT